MDKNHQSRLASFLPFTLTSIAFVILVVLVTSCNRTRPKPLIIATAANAQFAMEAISTEFEEITGIPTEVIISSSGKHTAQIEAGAPYDIFVSADLKYPQRLSELGLSTTPPKVYAFGQLVLWSTVNTDYAHIDSTSSISVKHFAIPNPATAPYGVAAEEYLRRINKWSLIEPKMVFGESVAQTNQYIISGSAELGITAASVVFSPKHNTLGKWSLIDQSLYSPIEQGAIIIKSTSQPENAEKFYLFLFSSKAQSILKRFGYKTLAPE